MSFPYKLMAFAGALLIGTYMYENTYINPKNINSNSEAKASLDRRSHDEISVKPRFWFLTPNKQSGENSTQNILPKADLISTLKYQTNPNIVDDEKTLTSKINLFVIKTEDKHNSVYNEKKEELKTADSERQEQDKPNIEADATNEVIHTSNDKKQVSNIDIGLETTNSHGNETVKKEDESGIQKNYSHKKYMISSLHNDIKHGSVDNDEAKYDAPDNFTPTIHLSE